MSLAISERFSWKRFGLRASGGERAKRARRVLPVDGLGGGDDDPATPPFRDFDLEL